MAYTSTRGSKNNVLVVRSVFSPFSARTQCRDVTVQRCCFCCATDIAALVSRPEAARKAAAGIRQGHATCRRQKNHKISLFGDDVLRVRTLLEFPSAFAGCDCCTHCLCETAMAFLEFLGHGQAEGRPLASFSGEPSASSRTRPYRQSRWPEPLQDVDVVFCSVDATTAACCVESEPLSLGAVGPVGDADLPRKSPQSRARHRDNLIPGGRRETFIYRVCAPAKLDLPAHALRCVHQVLGSDLVLECFCQRSMWTVSKRDRGAARVHGDPRHGRRCQGCPGCRGC